MLGMRDLFLQPSGVVVSCQTSLPGSEVWKCESLQEESGEGCISCLPGMAAVHEGEGRLLLPWELVEHPWRVLDRSLLREAPMPHPQQLGN